MGLWAHGQAPRLQGPSAPSPPDRLLLERRAQRAAPARAARSRVEQHRATSAATRPPRYSHVSGLSVSKSAKARIAPTRRREVATTNVWTISRRRVLQRAVVGTAGARRLPTCTVRGLASTRAVSGVSCHGQTSIAILRYQERRAGPRPASAPAANNARSPKERAGRHARVARRGRAGVGGAVAPPKGERDREGGDGVDDRPAVEGDAA